MCEWSARESFIDGEPRLLAYLGALRIAPAIPPPGRRAQGRLCGGATVFCITSARPPYALTAIAAENHAALRLLGAKLPGMPTYHPLEAFSTFALRPRPASLCGLRRTRQCRRSPGDRGVSRTLVSSFTIRAGLARARPWRSGSVSRPQARGFSRRPPRAGHCRLRCVMGPERIQADGDTRLCRMAALGAAVWSILPRHSSPCRICPRPADA